MIRLALCLLLAAPVLLHGQTPPTQANVPYGTHPQQVLDFYQAKSDKPTPLLFFVHGGGWWTGDKAKPDFLEQALQSGVSVVSINYRHIPHAMEQKIDPPVHASLHDAADALQFVRTKAAEWNFDKTRIAGCGGSAGGFTCLWLAFHPEMADPNSSNPVEKESTRLRGVLAFVPQTSLDPKQMKKWLPNIDYGHHAFGLPSFQAWLDKREELMPHIKEFSPYELATPDDPPVLLFYGTAPDMGKPFEDAVHHANFGAGLAEKLKAQGITHEFAYKGATGMKYPDLFSFFVEVWK